MSSGLSIQELSFAYAGGAPILKDLFLELQPGQITALMGPSGCGKSTLLRILMGLEPGASGQIRTHRGTFPFSEWTAAQRVFGMVPQVPNLLPWKTVRENIAIACPPGLAAEAARSRVEEVLRVVGLEAAAGKYPHEISQGMASRVAFARTLVMNIEALLLDEPFAALDALNRHRLQNWVRERIRDRALPSLFITHDVEEAAVVAHQIVVISRGPARIVGTFSPQEKDRVRTRLLELD